MHWNSVGGKLHGFNWLRLAWCDTVVYGAMCYDLVLYCMIWCVLKVAMRNESGLVANYVDLIGEVWFGVILYGFE